MKKTITMHIGHAYSMGHNFNKDFRAREEHIDPNLTDRNIILKQENIKDAYQKEFGEALEDYNNKQVEKGHPERQINNYLQHIRNDVKKHEAYEMIIQVGDRNTTGINNPDESHIDVMKEFYRRFEEDNPNLHIFGAVIHRDEKDGTDHMHITYFPVARNLKRGMEVQNSLNKALEQEGFKTAKGKGTELMQWTDRERGELERICHERGIEIEHKKEKREHFEKEIYIAYNKGQELKKENTELEQEVETKRTTVLTIDKDLITAREEYDKLKDLVKQPLKAPYPDKRILGKEYYSKEQMDEFEALAKAHSALQKEETRSWHERALQQAENANRAEKSAEQEHLFRLDLEDRWNNLSQVRIRLCELEKEHNREHEHPHDKDMQRIER